MSPLPYVKGEVIGIYGLLGAGRTELFKGLVGRCRARMAASILNGENIGRPLSGQTQKGWRWYRKTDRAKAWCR